jgi:hypothetical protein
MSGLDVRLQGPLGVIGRPTARTSDGRWREHRGAVEGQRYHWGLCTPPRHDTKPWLM